MYWFFIFFFVSGFCSILYELIWLRLAMAQFAVTTALVSIVLSTFMVGLGLGSWAAGYYLRKRPSQVSVPGIRLYALTELLIGVSAMVVPRELSWGRQLLERLGERAPFSAGLYYVIAGIWIGLTLVPWCACMGATFPVAMHAIRQTFPLKSPRSFSYLYVANVSGAVVGAVVPLLLIEKMGFTSTLHVGATLNFLLASAALMLSFDVSHKPGTTPAQESQVDEELEPRQRWSLLWLLFATGFTSMGIEVVWVRLFTPSLGTVVYAFAAILGLYLGATNVGSWIYKLGKSRRGSSGKLLWAWLGLSVLLPLFTCDPRLPIPSLSRVLAIIPFSLIVGFVTPMILDRYSSGDPERAGTGYAINILGCVLGPLLAGFFLLPQVGERIAISLFALPWFVIAFPSWTRSAQDKGRQARRLSWKAGLVGIASLVLLVSTKDYENQFHPREVRRDHTATVIAVGAKRGEKRLLVNGVGITALTPVTKMMAHLPLAFLPQPPSNALVICFGMGTTYRSMLSWGIRSSAVELVPSVPSLFPFFYADGQKLLESPLSRVVIDDGRFFLEKSSEHYDVIVIDPPPPVQAAGSSLLYSTEFYAILKRHLRPGGILQQWFPGSRDQSTLVSVAKALHESFPYVRVFHSFEGWGYHFLASESPLAVLPAEELANRLPAAANSDLVEWGPGHTSEEQFARVLSNELSLESLMEQAPDAPALHDDLPVNEYFLLRTLHERYARQSVSQWLASR